MRGTILNPAGERVEAVGLIAQALVAARPNLRLIRASAMPFLNDCSKVEEEARRQALADARSRADAIAAVEGLRLGAVRSVSEISVPPCQPATSGQSVQVGANMGIAEEPVVTVNLTENVTFAIH